MGKRKHNRLTPRKNHEGTLRKNSATNFFLLWLICALFRLHLGGGTSQQPFKSCLASLRIGTKQLQTWTMWFSHEMMLHHTTQTIRGLCISRLFECIVFLHFYPSCKSKVTHSPLLITSTISLQFFTFMDTDFFFFFLRGPFYCTCPGTGLKKGLCRSEVS